VADINTTSDVRLAGSRYAESMISLARHGRPEASAAAAARTAVSRLCANGDLAESV
jgi:hypothetical protein